MLHKCCENIMQILWKYPRNICSHCFQTRFNIKVTEKATELASKVLADKNHHLAVVNNSPDMK